MRLTQSLFEARKEGSVVDVKSMIKLGIDALALNFNAMHRLAEHRRANLRPSINPQFRAICAKVDKESPELLFGADLAQRLKDLKETSRVGAAFSQRPSTSKSGHFLERQGSRQRWTGLQNRKLKQNPLTFRLSPQEFTRNNGAGDRIPPVMGRKLRISN